MGPAVNLKTILLGIAVVAVSFFVSLKAMDWLWPRGAVRRARACRIAAAAAAPRSSEHHCAGCDCASAPSATPPIAARRAIFAGKADNPVSQILQNADIGWTASRGPITATGAQDVLSLATPLTGTLNVTGSLTVKATGAVGDALGGLLGGNVAKQIGSVNIKTLNANAEIKGNVTITARPKLAAAWRIEPNLAAQVNLGRHQPFGGGRPRQRPGAGQAADRQDGRRSDRRGAGADPQRSLARAERAGAMGQGLPLDPAARHRRGLVAAGALAGAAADPRDRGPAARRCSGGHADARHRGGDPHHPGRRPSPTARFPPRSPSSRRPPGGVSIGVPIDMPFTDINKIVEAQFAGRTFPEDGSGSVDVTVKRASVAASGDRLLISLLVNAKEKKSFFGFGGEANVHIWGKPVLDQAQQTLRLTDIELAVESEAAFGLLGAAARAAMPHLQKALADNATIDLKPFASNAQKKIAAVIADFQKNEDGVRVAAEITSLRLADIAFDSKTLRVIAEAEGAINVHVTALPGL